MIINIIQSKTNYISDVQDIIIDLELRSENFILIIENWEYNLNIKL